MNHPEPARRPPDPGTRERVAELLGRILARYWLGSQRAGAGLRPDPGRPPKPG